MTIEEKIRDIMADVLEIEDEITDDFGPEDSPVWDSMHHLRLMTAFEEEFKIKFTMEAVQSMVSFKLIKENIADHLA